MKQKTNQQLREELLKYGVSAPRANKATLEARLATVKAEADKKEELPTVYPKDEGAVDYSVALIIGALIAVFLFILYTSS